MFNNTKYFIKVIPHVLYILQIIFFLKKRSFMNLYLLFKKKTYTYE